MERDGNDAFAGFTAPKLLWVREHEPEMYARVGPVLLAEGLSSATSLTGEYAIDRAGGGGTLLLDLESRDWSGAVLDALDIDASTGSHRRSRGTAVTGTISAVGRRRDRA